MKTMKRMGCLLLVLAMCLALGVGAFAASDYTITIENATIGHTYSAYKIFDAAYDETTGGVSYTISVDNPWLDVIQSEGGFVDSGTGDNMGYMPGGASIFDLTLAASGNYYIVTLAEGVTDYEVASFFEEITVPAGAEAAATVTANSTTATLDVGEPGYYFVTSTLGVTVSITTAAPTATIIDKNEVVGGDNFYKYTTDAQGNVVENTDIALGSELKFNITSNVPLYAGDEVVTEYQFTDTLGDTGLEIEIEVGTDFTSGDITREMGSDGVYHYYASDALINQFVTLTDSNGSTYYLVGGTLNGVTVAGVAYDVTLEFTDVIYDSENGYIVCGGFILTYYTYDTDTYVEGDAGTFDTSKYLTDLTINISYTTYVTDNANHTETNTATLDYWTTSYDTPTPKNPIPHDRQTSTDYMYDWDLQIVKIDGENVTHLLEGATFTLEGANLKDVMVSTSVTYTPISPSDRETGTTYYYLLANGRYTTAAPTGDTADQYDSDYPGPYERSYKSSLQVTDAVNKTVTGTTDENGVVIFDGLSAGQYTLTEIIAPNGYNLLDNPIIFTVSFDSSDGTFSVDYAGAYFNDNGELVITVENNTGSELPSTGGIGTTIFYVIGAILVCGAVVLLVTKRRVNGKAEG